MGKNRRGFRDLLNIFMIVGKNLQSPLWLDTINYSQGCNVTPLSYVFIDLSIQSNSSMFNLYIYIIFFINILGGGMFVIIVYLYQMSYFSV